MKIALFTTGIFPYVVGGMQKHSYYLAKYFAQNGVYVDLYHYIVHNEPLVETLEGFSTSELKYIRHFCFHFEKPAKYPGHYIIESYNISKTFYKAFLENNSVDFVYAQGFSGWYYAKQKAQGTKLPPIGVNFHGLNMFQKAPSFRVKLEHLMFRCPVKRVLRLSDYTFSLGGKLTKILESMIQDPLTVLTTPIGIDRTWLINASKIKDRNNLIRKFIFIGRYERGKGVEELSEVLQSLLTHYSFEFHFIGPIPHEKQIHSTQVVYHGLVREEEVIKELLQASDVLVTPSYSEGMPTVILEAMASGCAIIATNVGAVCEEVNHENGWLIDAGDSATLQEVMIEAIECSDLSLQAKKVHSIDKIKEKFLWDDVIQQTLLNIKHIVNTESR